jgi:hypothetical protein
MMITSYNNPHKGVCCSQAFRMSGGRFAAGAVTHTIPGLKNRTN